MKLFCPVCNVVHEEIEEVSFRQVSCFCGTVYRFPLADEVVDVTTTQGAEIARLHGEITKVWIAVKLATDQVHWAYNEAENKPAEAHKKLHETVLQLAIASNALIAALPALHPHAKP